jgi:signal transduction histidine kinase
MLFLERVRGSGLHLLTLISELLDLSKIEAGRMELILTPTDPARLVADIAALLEVQADSRGVRLIADVDPGMPAIVTDCARLKQVLINLLGNALKFTDQGSVTLRARRTDNRFEPSSLAPGGRVASDGVVFEVIDTGIGIPADRLDAIFAPFEQAEATTHQRFGGTGLGLSISRELSQMLGGSLAVESTQGVGSTFRLTLPIVLPERIGGHERSAPALAAVGA